jgi:hypothetical protein
MQMPFSKEALDADFPELDHVHSRGAQGAIRSTMKTLGAGIAELSSGEALQN